ncbi:MAG: transcriptional regulator GcvA [Alphaproteobacteria bacterium]|nr:transcriptional regulator GcvA [Alphaproteobacteria bacterium]
MAERYPPLNALRTFECAGRHLSFVHAAEELNVTPGAVSRQVKALEEWLGAPLFRRRHKQVLLTPLGRSYLQSISEPLERIASATERALRQDAERPIAITCYPTFALRWLVPRWGRFYDQHPEIDVQLTTSLQPVDFSRGDVDAAILVGEGPQSWPGLDAVKLLDVSLFPVCNPVLCEGPDALRQISDLKRFTLLHGTPRQQDWQRWLEFAGVEDIDANSGVTFDSLNLSIQAAVEGLGIAIAVEELVSDDLAAGRLIQPFGPTRRSKRPFFLVYPPDRLRNRRLRAFKEWLCAESASD